MQGGNREMGHGDPRGSFYFHPNNPYHKNIAPHRGLWNAFLVIPWKTLIDTGNTRTNWLSWRNLHHWALDGVAGWTEYWPAKQGVTCSIQSQGSCLGCWPGSQKRVHKRQPHIDVSLPLFLPPFLSKIIKIQSFFKKEIDIIGYFPWFLNKFLRIKCSFNMPIPHSLNLYNNIKLIAISGPSDKLLLKLECCIDIFETFLIHIYLERWPFC